MRVSLSKMAGIALDSYVSFQLSSSTAVYRRFFATTLTNLNSTPDNPIHQSPTTQDMPTAGVIYPRAGCKKTVCVMCMPTWVETEMGSCPEAGSYSRLTDFCITQL